MPADTSLPKHWSCCGAPIAGRLHEPDDDVSPHEAYLRNKQLCVNTLVRHPVDKDLYCVVSRKDDRTKFCFPGGKVDPGDWPSPTSMAANNAGAESIIMSACVAGAVRETREESGLVVLPKDLVFIMGSCCFLDGQNNNRYAACFLAKTFSGALGTSEPIDVKWGRAKEAIDGPFGDLYGRMFARLKS